MAASGASSSLPNAPDEGSFAMRFADLRHGGLRGAGSALAKPPESRLDGDEGNEGGQGFGKVFEVFGQTSVVIASSRAMDELLPWRV
jgi:hypothetical protein